MNVGLYWHTIRNLKPIQIRGQIGRKLKRKKTGCYGPVPRYGNVHIFIPELDADEGYIRRFDIKGLMEGMVLLLHERYRLTGAWKVQDASHLWNYNLHYLEFTVPLAVEYMRTGDEKYKRRWMAIVSSYISSAGKNSDAYEPYTISLRLVNVLIGLELLGIKDREIYGSLYYEYRFLQEHMETALLANHYFENIKALVIASVLFNESQDYHKYFNLLLEQIDEQILSDGLHFERSFMYHKIILEDILRVWTVLDASGHKLDAQKLVPTIKAMMGALKSLEDGFPRTPLFNDAGDNVSKSTETLLKVCERIAGEVSHWSGGSDSGYYRLDHGNCAILFDCGDIGPGYMGGHAHNDALSFEVSVDGRMLFVNSGTGQYQGWQRPFFRSTPAHNTVMVDEREQSELWGEHRVGRRLSHIKTIEGPDWVAGQFRSYQGDWIRRRLQWKEHKLLIKDTVLSSGRHKARQFLHLAPGFEYRDKEGFLENRKGNTKELAKGNRLETVDEEGAADVPKRNCLEVVDEEGAVVAVIKFWGNYQIYIKAQIAAYAPEFGKLEQKQVLEICSPFSDRAERKIVIELYRSIRRW